MSFGSIGFGSSNSSSRGSGSSRRNSSNRTENKTESQRFGASSQQSPTLSSRKSYTRAGEISFAAKIRKEALNRAFNGGGTTGSPNLGEQSTSVFGTGGNAGNPFDVRAAQYSPVGQSPTDLPAAAQVEAENTLRLPEFSRSLRFFFMSREQKAAVRADMQRLLNTESYRAADLNDQSRARMREMIFAVSMHSHLNPENATVRNSLEKVLSGETEMGMYFDEREYVGGKAPHEGRIEININATGIESRSRQQHVDIFVHEINHTVNGISSDFHDRFVDEYRAYFVGREASGQSFTGRVQEEVLDQLIKNGGYPHLTALYNENRDFRTVIDSIYADLRGSEPDLTTPEELRTLLLNAGFSPNYLRTTGNLDNR